MLQKAQNLVRQRRHRGHAVAAVDGVVALEIEKVATPRPMTHDLIRNLLFGLEAGVKKVVVSDLKEDTFYAVIIFGAARSQGFTCASIQISASPRATIMASMQPPKHRTDQNGFVQETISFENPYLGK